MTKQNPNLLKALTFLPVPELLVASLIAATAGDTYRISSFWLALGCFYGVYFLIWVRNSIWGWIVYAISRKEAVDNTLKLLKENDLPKPYSDLYSPSEYFEEVSKDERMPIKARLLASQILGMSVYPMSAFRFQEGYRLHLMLKSTLARLRGSYDNSEINGEPDGAYYIKNS